MTPPIDRGAEIRGLPVRSTVAARIRRRRSHLGDSHELAGRPAPARRQRARPERRPAAGTSPPDGNPPSREVLIERDLPLPGLEEQRHAGDEDTGTRGNRRAAPALRARPEPVGDRRARRLLADARRAIVEKSLDKIRRRACRAPNRAEPPGHEAHAQPRRCGVDRTRRTSPQFRAARRSGCAITGPSTSVLHAAHN